MARRKPGIGGQILSETWGRRITECIEVVMGRRGGKVREMAVTATKAASTPTAAEFNRVVDDLNAMKARFNELLKQVQD